MRRKKSITITTIAILLMTFIIVLGGRDAFSDLLYLDSPEPTLAPGIGTKSRSSVSEPDRFVASPTKLSDRTGLDQESAPCFFLPSEVNLYSPHAIVISLDTQELIFDKESNAKVYPASLTKIMTVITAIENIDSLNSKVLLSEDIYDYLVAENSSMAGFLPNEEVPVIDLLYGAMLPSGGECCLSLAEYTAGSESDFVQLMNDKASELGMDGTHFMNTTGLHDSKHYTTVRDLAVLLQYSLRNDTFRQIFTTQRYTTSSTKMHPDGITMYSTLFKKLPDSYMENVTLLGGKTGYTSKAGLCLASLAKIGEDEYIMISAGAEGNHATEQYNITDALSVYSLISGKQLADKSGS